MSALDVMMERSGAGIWRILGASKCSYRDFLTASRKHVSIVSFHHSHSAFTA